MAYLYVPRERWGAAPPTGRYSEVERASKGVVHHTAGQTDASYELEGKPGPKWYRLYYRGTTNLRIRRAINAYTKKRKNVMEKEVAAMKSWQRYHQSLGWNDIGYHRVIFPSGHVYEGRPLGVRGAHAINGNHLPGYSFAGNFEVQEPTKQALYAFNVITQQDRVTSFIGHYRIPGNSTACPGKNLKAALNV